MPIFKNIFDTLPANSKVNFELLAELRRVKMGREGHEINHIDWKQYAKILEAKHKKN